MLNYSLTQFSWCGLTGRTYHPHRGSGAGRWGWHSPSAKGPLTLQQKVALLHFW